MSGKPIDHGNVVYLKAHRFENGYPFPQSYQDFALKYGYGLTMGLFLIYIPMDDYGDAWEIRSEEMRGTYIDRIGEGKEPPFKLAPDGSIDLLKTWVPFAMSENGEYLFWDIREQKDNEFDIYISDFRTGIRKAARSLDELFEKLTDPERFKQVLPYHEEPLEPSFEPYGRLEEEDVDDDE